jgi:hypothetical protein
MSADLNKLRVSLTKHGAHKISFLLQKFDKDDVLNHLSGDYLDIIIDSAQTRGILSINSEGKAPEIWDEIKKYGQEDIFDLVFLAIVFSHIDLINAIKKAVSDGCIIKRGDIVDGKVYTNLAHIIDEFGFSIEHTSEYIKFDISRLFYKFYIPKLFKKLLEIKLIEAGWNGIPAFIDECNIHEFYKVFGLTKDDFNEWITESNEFTEPPVSQVKSERNFKDGIMFKQGHNTKYEGDITVITNPRRKATLIHNKIQNEVFKILEKEFPKNEIGTEVKTNVGSIDIVRKNHMAFIFYEIKTSQSIKTNIRQGLAQLLEYAYWNDIKTIIELIIIGPCPSNEQSKKYLKRLRDEFQIPIYYRYFDLESLNLLDKN